MIKKTFTTLFIFLVGVGLYLFFTDNSSEWEDEDKDKEEKAVKIKTFTNDRKLDDYEFLKNAKPPVMLNSKKENNGNNKKSIGSLESERKIGVTIQGRNIIGAEFRKLDQVPHDYVFGNEYNPNWKAMALKEFNDEDEEGTSKIEIQQIDSLIFMREKQAMFIEKVKSCMLIVMCSH